MQAVIDRTYCLKNPFKIVRLFGLDVLFGMLLGKDKTLLERITRKYRASGVPMPGSLGNAYKLSILFELRVARIYAAMAERFGCYSEVCALFLELEEEEVEHARIMLACLYQVAISPKANFVPSVRDPAIRESLHRLRETERRVPRMSLEEALRITLELEASEVNIIFGRLLKQVDKAQTRLFAEHLEGAQSHPESVPRRILELKARLGPEGLAGAV
jgi:hypothetical protein